MTTPNIIAQTQTEPKTTPLTPSVGPIMTTSDPKLILPLPAPVPNNRRNGKVARLPKNLRDLINQMLDDGATYSAIIEKLNADHQISLNPDNLSNWHSGGYQDWLKLQLWHDQIRLQHEAFSDLLAENPATKLPEVALQIAASEIFRRLRDLTAQAQALSTEADPIHFTRLVNSLARISREVLHLQKYHDAQAQAAQLQMLDPKRELTEEERTAILDKIDDIFGCKAYRRRHGELPILGPAVLPPNDPLPAMPTPSSPPSSALANASPHPPAPATAGATHAVSNSATVPRPDSAPTADDPHLTSPMAHRHALIPNIDTPTTNPSVPLVPSVLFVPPSTHPLTP